MTIATMMIRQRRAHMTQTPVYNVNGAQVTRFFVDHDALRSALQTEAAISGWL